jgi:hypothetical protein
VTGTYVRSAVGLAVVGATLDQLLGTVGIKEGVSEGGCVGEMVGDWVGAPVGCIDGCSELKALAPVGIIVGAAVGAYVGAIVGFNVGSCVGCFVGVAVGSCVGAPEGGCVGAFDAPGAGFEVGADVGWLVAAATLGEQPNRHSGTSRDWAGQDETPLVMRRHLTTSLVPTLFTPAVPVPDSGVNEKCMGPEPLQSERATRELMSDLRSGVVVTVPAPAAAGQSGIAQSTVGLTKLRPLKHEEHLKWPLSSAPRASTHAAAVWFSSLIRTEPIPLAASPELVNCRYAVSTTVPCGITMFLKMTEADLKPPIHCVDPNQPSLLVGPFSHIEEKST